MRFDARDQRIAVVVEPLLPRRIADPRELAVAPDAEKRDVAGGLVVLPDMRVVDVADVVFMIEVDHEIAVADGKVARHGMQDNPVEGGHEETSDGNRTADDCSSA